MPEEPKNQPYDQPVRVDEEGKNHHTMKMETLPLRITVGNMTGWIKPPPDHPIYAKVGLVASNWSHVEKMLDECIWFLVDKHDRRLVACLTGQYSGTFPRYNAIIALLKAKGALTPELDKRLKKEQGECAGAGNKRNRIVHDAWMVNVEDPTDIAAHRSWPKEDRTFGVTEISNDDIEDALRSIQERLEDAVRLKNDLNQLFS